MADKDDKTEKATGKRRSEARKKGTVLQSKEVTTVFSMAAAFFGLQVFLPHCFDVMQQEMTRFLGVQQQFTFDPQGILRIGGEVVLMSFSAALPFCVIAAMASIVVTLGQTRGLFTMQTAKFKMSNLNPLSGIKRVFSLRGLMELCKGILKFSIVFAVLYFQLKDSLPRMIRLVDVTPIQAMITVGSLVMDMVWAVVSIYVFVAAADYLLEWYRYEKNLKMSKQEVKDEYKETEGNPEIKGKIRQKQQEMAQRRMMQQVPLADVVIRNPTHYAIAIRYRLEEDPAPVVLAKGADELALRIVKVAEEAGVYITENRPLARGMYDAVEVDGFIPAEFYQPVAKVLAFVYHLREQEKAQGASPKPKQGEPH